MTKVYRHKPVAPDELVGRVTPEGRVFETRLGPDKQVGRVETDTGRIFETRLGPDKHLGRVALDTGKVYRERFGPDEYVGRVDPDGKLYRHKPLALDEYLGRMAEMPSYAHGGAALLLLLLPLWEEDQAADTQPAKPSEANPPAALPGAAEAQ